MIKINNLLKVQYRSIFLEVDILISTEVFGEWNTREILAPATLFYGDIVEHQDEDEEKDGDDAKTETDDDGSPGPGVYGPIICNVWHQSVGEEEAGDESQHVGVVVHPGQQTQEEEDGEDNEELGESQPGLQQYWPDIDHLHYQTRQHSELSTCWS